MTKQEFLEGLRRALFSTGSNALIEENMRFYSSYIDGELQKGRSSEEVMEELGDPRLIANSIKVANGYEDVFTGLDNSQENFGERDFSEERQSDSSSYEKRTGDQYEGVDNNRNFKIYDLTGKGAVIAIITAVLLLTAVIVAAAVIVGGIVSVFAPVLVPVILIFMVFKLIKFLGKQ